MLRFLESMQFVLFVFFTAAYAYQIVYLIIGWVGKGKGGNENAKLHRYAAVVAARNESAVIANLIRTLKEQDYPSELLDIYVIADNCTDNTAEIARNAGAYVYERFNKVQVGKGYALEYLFHHIFEDKGEMTYDGFFVFDADNIVDKQFVREMNKMFDTGEYTALTSYRNSQNFCANWISAGYALWFLRESRFLNRPRTQLGVNCAVSGTGFLVSSQAIREDGGWPYHLLTEDIEFSIACASRGRRIGYCGTAVIYDEQPAPLPFAVTVPDGQPRFRLTSPQPRLPSRFAAQMKSAAVFVSSCGTAGTPSLYSGSTSRFWRGVSFGCVVGVMNGMKYLSMPGKNS